MESPLFKSSIPLWLAKMILFILLLPNMVLFFLPVANLDVAAGHYGIEPNQITFMVSLYYAGFVSFYSLERRFYSYFTYKRYFLIFQIIQMMGCFVLFKTNNLYLIYLVRFLQGMLFASAVNLYLSMLALKIKNFKAREVSFSVFFGMLLCTTSFNNLITADLIDQFNFDFLFHCLLLIYAFNLLLVLLTMRVNETYKSIPLIQLDFLSFILFSIFIICFGYCSTFGQQNYWLQSKSIVNAILLGTVSIALFIYRQTQLKRPYIHLNIFKYREFIFGISILFIMYIFRFSFSYSGTFFSKVLGMDPRHVSYMYALNLIGILTGVTISCIHLIKKRNIYGVWIVGFISLLTYHILMNGRMYIYGNENNYFMPMFLHGLGVGLIMVPTILYCISNVKLQYAPSAAAFCLFVRFSGYTVSNILINYYTLYNHAQHKDKFLNATIGNNPFYTQHIQSIQNKLISNGFNDFNAGIISSLLFQKELEKQILLRSVMDYYTLMIYLCAVIILFLIFRWIQNKNVILKIRTILPI